MLHHHYHHRCHMLNRLPLNSSGAQQLKKITEVKLINYYSLRTSLMRLQARRRLKPIVVA